MDSRAPEGRKEPPKPRRILCALLAPWRSSPPVAFTVRIALAISLLAVPSALAQTDAASGPATDPIRNPVNIGEEIDAINAPRKPLAPVPGLDAVWQPWYDFKAGLATNYGVQFGVAWTPLYQVATDSLDGKDQAAGGIFEFLGRWTFLDRDGDHPGLIGFRVENRHRLWTTFPPQSLFTHVGAGTPTAIGFSKVDLSIAELYYEQDIIKNRFIVRAGKTLPFGIYDFFFFKNPKTDFMNANFALNPAIAWPQFGLGVATEVRPWEEIYILAGIHDANGAATRAGFDTFFDDREYFVVGEVGWDPGYLNGDQYNPMAPDIHATFWHVDARTRAGLPEGWGVSLTGQKAFGPIVPFARYGYSDGGPALLQHLVMAGIGWTQAFGYAKDVVGAAVSYGKPSANGLRDQYTGELYYRMQLTRRLALTPSIQLIANPSANPNRDLLALFGFRGRLDF